MDTSCNSCARMYFFKHVNKIIFILILKGMCFLCFYLHVVGSMLDAWKGSKALHIRCRRFAIFIHCIFFYKFCQHCGCRGMRSAFKLFFTDKTGIIQSYKWTSPFPILGLLVVFFIQILTKHSLSKHLRT